MDSRPAYRRIADRVKQDFLTGPDVRPGSRLPAERHFQARFGVSRATVSRALSALAAEGLIETRPGSGAYVADPGISIRNPRMIGFVSPVNPLAGDRANPVLARLHRGLEQRAHALGYQLLTACSHLDVDHEADLIDQLVSLGVAGLVVYPAYFPAPRPEPSRDPLALRWADTPIVLVDIGREEWGRDMVVFDNRRLGADLTRGLVELGRKRILFCDRPGDALHNTLHDRARGWRDAMAEAGLPIPLAWDGWPGADVDPFAAQNDTVSATVDRLLALDPLPDAVVAYDDDSAMRLIRELRSRGVAVPETILVAGCDNHDAAEWFNPPFPTTNPDFAGLGHSAIDLLDRHIAGHRSRPRTQVHPVSVHWLHRGESVADSQPKGGLVAARA